MGTTANRMERLTVILAWTGAGVALGCIFVAFASGLGNRIGAWDYRVALTVLRGAVYVAAGAGVVALAALVLAVARGAERSVGIGIAGVAIAFALVLPAWNLQRAAAQLPRIHDITTDTRSPPQFVASLPERRQSPNGAAYEGAEAARQQQAAYPDIQPAVLDNAPAQAFDRALEVARKMGWDIVAAELATGRIEATATTFWFGFKDDVVIRITPAASGSRLDIRSASRVGRSDIGTNAKRIRAYLAALKTNS